eukprot:4411921-Alexandrium_andersonii.AAC.1
MQPFTGATGQPVSRNLLGQKASTSSLNHGVQTATWVSGSPSPYGSGQIWVRVGAGAGVSGR